MVQFLLEGLVGGDAGFALLFLGEIGGGVGLGAVVRGDVEAVGFDGPVGFWDEAEGCGGGVEGGDGDVGGGCVWGSGEGGGEEGGVAVGEFCGVGEGFGVGAEERRDVFGDGAGLKDWGAERVLLVGCSGGYQVASWSNVDIQLSSWVGFFDGFGYSRHHLVELRTASCGKSLSVCLLQEPELLKRDDGVTAGDFEVELVDVSG